MKSIVTKSRQFQVYESVQGRMILSNEDKGTCYNLKSGYEGEKRLFFLFNAHLKNNYIPLYGIMLENNGTLYQIDCLIIFTNQLILIEVKNYKGEFECKEERLCSITTGKYYQNPLHQLQRCHIHLQESLSKFKLSMPLQSYVVFINQEFTLFDKKNAAIVLPSQIQSFIKRLHQIQGTIGVKHESLANTLIGSHIEDSPYMRIPEYQYDTLKKGIYCLKCRGRMHLQGTQLFCQRCTYKESTDSGVLRNIIEFSFLFPETKITTSKITEWCAIDLSSRSIRRILQAYLQQCLTDKKTYFRFK